MSYIHTHNVTKTLLALLFGLPFVFGAFSNVRPAIPDNGPYQHAPQALFDAVPVQQSPQA